MSPADPPSLAERYGAPSPLRRRVLVAAVGVLVVAFGVWLVWVIIDQSRPEVTSGHLTYEITGSQSVTARFKVELHDDDVRATCTVRAYAADHTLVGSLAVVVDPEPDGAVEVTVATERLADSVELIGCTAPGQSRPR